MKIVIKKKSYINLFLILYMFCIIYAPPFFSLNFFHVVFAFSFFAIVFFHRNRVYAVIKNMSMIPMFVLVLCNAFLFLQSCSIASFRNMGIKPIYQIYLLYQSIFMVVEMLICAIYIGCVLQKYSISKDVLFGYICKAGIIQFCLAFMAYINSDIRFYFLDIIGSNSNLTSLYSNYNDYLSYRGYGFAISLLDEFGYGTGIIGGIAYILAKRNKRYYVVVLMMGITTLLNSRTGIIMMAIFVVCDWLIGNSTKIKQTKLLQVIGAAIVLVVLWLFILPGVLNFIFYNTTEEIVKNTVRDLIQVINFNYHTLRSEMWTFSKDGIALLLGTGAHVSGTISTVGYVNIIWGFGILGTGIIYIIFCVFFNKVLQKSKINLELYKINLALFIVFFVVQLKMPVLNYSAGGILLFSVPLWTNMLMSKGEIIHGN